MKRQAPRKLTEITLFDKNRIKIVKHIDLKAEHNYFVNASSSKVVLDNNKGQSIHTPHSITKKSPLGFYYKSVDVEPEEKSREINSAKMTICINDHAYVITYITSASGVTISPETRPWMLDPKNKGFSDHMVNSLLATVDDIFSEAMNDKGFKSDSKELASLQDNKMKLYVDLFGDKKGPRFQSDKEKIESHGFDYKISFRNRKTE